MVKVGDRIRLSSLKGPDRQGVHATTLRNLTQQARASKVLEDGAGVSLNSDRRSLDQDAC